MKSIGIFCRICKARQPPPLPPSPAQSLPKVIFFRASSSTLFVSCKICQFFENGLEQGSLWRFKSAKFVPKCNLECNTKKNFEKIPKMMQTSRPSTPKNKHFSSEVLHFCSFAASPTNTQNDIKMDLKMTPNLTKLVPEAPQKQCQKQAQK